MTNAICRNALAGRRDVTWERERLVFHSLMGGGLTFGKRIGNL